MDKDPRAAGVTLEVPTTAQQAGPGTAAGAYLSGLAASGQRSQRSALKACARLLGYRTAFELKWETVTAAEVRGLRARLRGLYEGATVNRTLSALRGVLKLAQGNPLPLLLKAELDGNEPERSGAGRELGMLELGKLFTATRPSDDGIRDAAIIAVMYGAGLRKDSVPKLDVADYGDERLVLRKAKGGKTYTAQIHPAMKMIVDRWLDVRGHDDGPLFPQIHHGQVTRRRLSSSAIAEAIERLRLRAGVDPFTPHDLRRTFGTRLLDEGVDPMAVAKLMGHANVATTMRYDKRGPERLRELVAKLPEPSGAAPAPGTGEVGAGEGEDPP